MNPYTHVAMNRLKPTFYENKDRVETVEGVVERTIDHSATLCEDDLEGTSEKLKEMQSMIARLVQVLVDKETIDAAELGYVLRIQNVEEFTLIGPTKAKKLKRDLDNAV